MDRDGSDQSSDPIKSDTTALEAEVRQDLGLSGGRANDEEVTTYTATPSLPMPVPEPDPCAYATGQEYVSPEEQPGQFMPASPCIRILVGGPG
jgi:hypothetical protein